jgi:cell division protein ZapA (FtsZ GTPase activity inhibitor)
VSTHDEEDLDARFAGLEAASRGLSADVTALNSTLLVVADLQRKQREQAARQQKTEQEIAAARQMNAERDARTRTATRAFATALAILIPLISILVYWSLIVHVNELLSTQSADRFTGCQVRNDATRENATRENALGQLESDPKLKALHLDSAAQLNRSLVNCDKYKPKS